MSRGFFAREQFNITMSAYFKVAAGFFEAVRVARRARITHFPSGDKALHDTATLSAELAIVMDGKPLRGAVSDHFATKAIEIQADEPGAVRLIAGGMGVLIRELLRADLDEDGEEEMFVLDHMYAIGGTLQGVEELRDQRAQTYRTLTNGEFDYGTRSFRGSPGRWARSHQGTPRNPHLAPAGWLGP
jgi:hypothetical protein